MCNLLKLLSLFTVLNAMGKISDQGAPNKTMNMVFTKKSEKRTKLISHEMATNVFKQL